MKVITLKSGKEQPVRRFHPWVFSGAIAKEEPGIQEGEIVELRSKEGVFLGKGHYQEGSIRLRLFAFEDVEIDSSFWKKRLLQAWQYREKIGLTHAEKTNCFRLVHAEGDGLPGLIIDVYGKTAVLQCHSIGMYQLRTILAEALSLLPGRPIEAVYCKSRQSLPERFKSIVEDDYLVGEKGNTQVSEYGHLFSVDWEQGQKTGFFLDQRENRQLLARYAPGKRVLNTFCYTGGFSIYALAAGASSVHSVDISGDAIKRVILNDELNFPGGHPDHMVEKADVMKFLTIGTPPFDIVVVDPPAFAKTRAKRHKAVMAYKRLNTLAIKSVDQGGMLFTFSCSQVVDEALFYNTIVAAVLESGRKARIMHRLSQPPDHPVSMSHPEGHYLKGLVLQLD